MPVMNQVERNSLWGRVMVVAIYAILCVGGITMIYPFAVMLSGSISSGVDSEEYRIVPAYLYNDTALFLKYVEARYCEKIKYNPTENLNRHWLSEFTILSSLGVESAATLRPLAMRGEGLKAQAADWREFNVNVPAAERIRCFDGILHFDFLDYVLARHGDPTGVRAALGVDYEALRLPFENPYKRNWRAPDSKLYEEYLSFIVGKDKSAWTIPVLFDGEFILYLRSKYPTLDTLNAALDTNYKSFSEITLSSRCPATGLGKEWLNFVRRNLALRYCRIKGAADFPEAMPADPEARSRWTDYVVNKAPPHEIGLETADNRFREFLRAKYHDDIAALNSQWGSAHQSFDAVPAPLLAADFEAFSKEKAHWRWFFLSDNYRVVWRYIAVNGMALWNTVILCFFTVLAQLTVNPMCAYALSRYRMRHKHLGLMFFIATMAFPQMVLMIPNFVLLRELGMLNTYWALIVPTMANGYYIFLMKGFFDSLPKELYEAASIDGASEFTVLTKITVPLIQPILAVKALGAFTAAYGGFMWAFIICQDPKMWTISVYLYQFQQSSPYHLTMASLVIASLPLLLMFLFCQGIIMRGIVIPVMK